MRLYKIKRDSFHIPISLYCKTKTKKDLFIMTLE